MRLLLAALLLAAPAKVLADDAPPPPGPAPRQPPPVERPVAAPPPPPPATCVIRDDLLSEALPLTTAGGSTYALVEGPLAVKLSLPVGGPPRLRIESDSLWLEGGSDLTAARAFMPRALPYDGVARIRAGTALLVSAPQEKDVLLTPQEATGYEPADGKPVAVRVACGDVTLERPNLPAFHPPAGAKAVWLVPGTAIAASPSSPPAGKVLSADEVWVLGKKRKQVHVLVRTPSLDLDGWVSDQAVGPAPLSGHGTDGANVGYGVGAGFRTCSSDLTLQVVPGSGAPEPAGMLKKGARIYSRGRQGGLTLISVEGSEPTIHLQGGASLAIATVDFEESCGR